MIKLTILKWEDYLGLSHCAQCNHKSLYKKEIGDQRGKSNSDTKAEIGMIWHHEARNSCILQKLEEATKGSLILQEKHGLAYPFQTSDPHNYNVITLCCLKPLSLW